MLANTIAVTNRIVAEHLCAARRWIQQAQKQTDRRGFARAIGTEKTEYDSRRHFEREILQCRDLARNRAFAGAELPR